MKIVKAQSIAYSGFSKKEKKDDIGNSQNVVVNDAQQQTIVPLRSNNTGVLTFGGKVKTRNKIIEIASKYINTKSDYKKSLSTLMFEKDKALNVYKKLKDDKSLQEKDRITIANLVYCQNYSEIYKMADEIEKLPNDLNYDKDYKNDNRFDNKTKDVIDFAKNVVKTMSVKNPRGEFIIHDAENEHREEKDYSEKNPRGEFIIHDAENEHREEKGYSEKNPQELAKYLKKTLAYELAICQMQNKDFFRLLKSTCKKNVDNRLSKTVDKVCDILSNNRKNIRLTPFPLSLGNINSRILNEEEEKEEKLVIYYDVENLAEAKRSKRNAVPFIKLNAIERFNDEKQKRVFKLLGFKDGTSFENLRLLIHSINCVNSLNGIDELNQDIKPDTVLSTSTYSKNKKQIYAGQGFIMSNWAQILYGKANQDEIFSGSAKSRRQVGKWLDPQIDLSPSTLERNNGNCNEIMTTDNKVAAVYIKEDIYDDKTRFNKNNVLVRSLLEYAKRNNLPVVVLSQY